MEQQKLLFQQGVLFEWVTSGTQGLVSACPSVTLTLACRACCLVGHSSGKKYTLEPFSLSLVSQCPGFWGFIQSPYLHQLQWLQVAMLTSVLGSMAFCSIFWEEAIISDPNPGFQCQLRWGSLLHLPLSLTNQKLGTEYKTKLLEQPEDGRKKVKIEEWLVEWS